MPEKEKEVRAIFGTRPFGELERLVTQKLLDVAKRIAKEELESENTRLQKLVAELLARNQQLRQALESATRAGSVVANAR